MSVLRILRWTVGSIALLKIILRNHWLSNITTADNPAQYHLFQEGCFGSPTSFSVGRLLLKPLGKRDNFSSSYRKFYKDFVEVRQQSHKPERVCLTTAWSRHPHLLSRTPGTWNHSTAVPESGAVDLPRESHFLESSPITVQV